MALQRVDWTSGEHINGGPVPTHSSTDPFDMGTKFQQWIDILDNFPEQAVPNSMYWQKWYDISEVQKVVDNMSNHTLVELFTREPPTTKTFAVLYDKYGEYSLFRKTVNQTLQWKCAQDDVVFQATL